MYGLQTTFRRVSRDDQGMGNRSKSMGNLAPRREQSIAELQKLLDTHADHDQKMPFLDTDYRARMKKVMSMPRMAHFQTTPFDSTPLPIPELEDEAEEKSFGAPSTITPTLLAFFAGMGSLMFGINIGFSSPTELDVIASTSFSKSTTDIMFSLISVGAILGCLCAGSVSSHFGRVLALLSSVVPYLLGMHY